MVRLKSVCDTNAVWPMCGGCFPRFGRCAAAVWPVIVAFFTYIHFLLVSIFADAPKWASEREMAAMKSGEKSADDKMNQKIHYD